MTWSATTLPSHKTPVKKERLIKWTILTYRKEGMSEDEFNEYWTNTHAPKVKEWLAKYGIVKYAQYHTPSDLRKACSQITGTSVKDTNLAEYDGYAEFWMRDIENMIKAREDPYYKDVVAPDEENFFDMSKSQMTVGWDEVYVQDGKVL